MFFLEFNNKYKIVHLTNELGNYYYGGVGTYINEIYRYRRGDMGFIYVDFDSDTDYRSEEFLEKKDIAVVTSNEIHKLQNIKCDILVVHFYELWFCLTPEIIKDKKIVYVIHSVPTPEPAPDPDPFIGNEEVRNRFFYICDVADILICVSFAEKRKLEKIYPQFADKIKVVHNGMSFNENVAKNRKYENGRKNFGYIGRLDYRKGVLEGIKAIERTEGELYLACPDNDHTYFKMIKNYIDGARLWDRIHFLGWCAGDRKEEFFMFVDALIIPSLYEPFGYTALEAMNFSVPVISSDNGGLSEILEGYKYTYNPYIEEDLYKCICEFQTDDAKEVAKQVDILEKNKTGFTAKDMCDNYYRIWKMMLNEQNI